MATVRYVGPEDRVRVGHPLYREVSADEAVEVPDEWLEDYAWASELWQVEGSSDDPRTVKQLQSELRELNLSTSGTKAELIERLAQPPAEKSGE